MWLGPNGPYSTTELEIDIIYQDQLIECGNENPMLLDLVQITGMPTTKDETLSKEACQEECQLQLEFMADYRQQYYSIINELFRDVAAETWFHSLDVALKYIKKYNGYDYIPGKGWFTHIVKLKENLARLIKLRDSILSRMAHCEEVLKNRKNCDCKEAIKYGAELLGEIEVTIDILQGILDAFIAADWNSQQMGEKPTEPPPEEEWYE